MRMLTLAVRGVYRARVGTPNHAKDTDNQRRRP
jgi:hypothetical protein